MPTATPIFAQVPISTAIAVSATANVSRAVSTGVPTNSVLISPNTNTGGIRIDQINIYGLGNTLAGQIIIWLFDGTSAWPIAEASVTATTPSTTVPGFYTNILPVNLVLGIGYKLYATSQVASQLVSVGISAGVF